MEGDGVFYKREKDKLPCSIVPRDYKALKELFSHHIASFDYMFEQGLKEMLSAIQPVYVFDSVNNKNK